MPSAPVNANTRQSVVRSRKTRLFSVPRNPTRKALSHLRDEQAAGRADDGQQQALRQQLTHDSAPRRADGETHGDFALPRRRPREHQVRQVRARDHEDETGGREQQPQRCFVVAAQRETPVPAGRASA